MSILPLVPVVEFPFRSARALPLVPVVESRSQSAQVPTGLQRYRDSIAAIMSGKRSESA